MSWSRICQKRHPGIFRSQQMLVASVPLHFQGNSRWEQQRVWNSRLPLNVSNCLGSAQSDAPEPANWTLSALFDYFSMIRHTLPWPILGEGELKELQQISFHFYFLPDAQSWQWLSVFFGDSRLSHPLQMDTSWKSGPDKPLLHGWDTFVLLKKEIWWMPNSDSKGSGLVRLIKTISEIPHNLYESFSRPTFTLA